MNKTRILLIIAIVVSEIFTIIQFRGKGDSAKSYSLFALSAISFISIIPYERTICSLISSKGFHTVTFS